jgi:hypothetical protein
MVWYVDGVLKVFKKIDLWCAKVFFRTVFYRELSMAGLEPKDLTCHRDETGELMFECNGRCFTPEEFPVISHLIDLEQYKTDLSRQTKRLTSLMPLANNTTSRRFTPEQKKLISDNRNEARVIYDQYRQENKTLRPPYSPIIKPDSIPNPEETGIKEGCYYAHADLPIELYVLKVVNETAFCVGYGELHDAFFVVVCPCSDFEEYGYVEADWPGWIDRATNKLSGAC